MFKELRKEEVEKNEEYFANYWKEHDILNKSIQNRSDYWVLYDGPATANPMPLIRYIKSIYSNFLLNQGITG